MISLCVSDLTHEYDERLVFRSVSLEFEGSCLSITGHNGSGKSTLMRILAGLLTPTQGRAEFSCDGMRVARDSLRNMVGLAAPDVGLYGELSARENLAFLSSVRFGRIDSKRIERTLESVGLAERSDDPVNELSSGLRQRACFAAAILHEPPILLLDEPSSNLDDRGVAMLKELIALQKERGMVIIATNDASEAALAQETLRLGVAH